MPLNEDALRKAFFRRCEKDGSFNMAAFKTLEDGSFANTFLENLFSDFKHKCEVAYSPEVLQALGVAVVPISQPNEVAALKAALNFNLTDAKRYRTLRDEALHFSFEDSARETAWIVLGSDCKDCHPTFMGNEIDDVVDAMIEAIKEQS